jgi:hypothetical protein
MEYNLSKHDKILPRSDHNTVENSNYRNSKKTTDFATKKYSTTRSERMDQMIRKKN